MIALPAYASIQCDDWLCGDAILANLSVRKLGDDTYERLRVRATRHGVSMEEEVRRILMRAVSAPEHSGDLFLAYFGPANGVDLELPASEPHEPMDLAQ